MGITKNSIDGVVLKPLTIHRDDRGFLMEIMRSDDALFRRFGQLYLTTARPGVVKAWHCHAKQTDHLAVVAGAARIALYDGREGSPTFGVVMDLIAGPDNAVLVIVPPGVYHGFKPEGAGPAYVLNMPTELYDKEYPDEIRKPYNDDAIPYDWGEADPASG